LYNREAARYARWAAWTAALIALIVAGVYGERMIRATLARRHGPAPVPASVQQQSNQISFSKVEQNRTVFTIRASHATEYKDRNRSLLEDVWITIYGKHGQRDDNIHTRECSYEPETGDVRCEGDVQIDIGSAKADGGNAKAATSNESLRVTTSNLLFNRNTGEASTQAPVEFRFAGGSGRGVGISYSTRDSIVRVEHSVEFDLAPSAATDNLPVTATGASLEVRRDQRTVVLDGPALVRQGGRELSAGTISVELDELLRKGIRESGRTRAARVRSFPRIDSRRRLAQRDASRGFLRWAKCPRSGRPRVGPTGSRLLGWNSRCCLRAI
jgi:LPS export ABC transporter protein LptC